MLFNVVSGELETCRFFTFFSAQLVSSQRLSASSPHFSFAASKWDCSCKCKRNLNFEEFFDTVFSSAQLVAAQRWSLLILR